MNQDQFKRINKKKYRLPSFGMIMIPSFFPVVKAVFYDSFAVILHDVIKIPNRLQIKTLFPKNSEKIKNRDETRPENKYAGLRNQMLDKYLYSEPHEHYSAAEHSPTPELCADGLAELFSEQHAEQRENKGSDTDSRENEGTRTGIEIKAPEYDSGRERIYARRYRHNYQSAERKRVRMLILGLVLYGFYYHLAADEGEQHECNPVIEIIYKGLHTASENSGKQGYYVIPYHGHESLEGSEEQSHFDGIPKPHAA
mgnify:FL=1